VMKYLFFLSAEIKLVLPVLCCCLAQVAFYLVKGPFKISLREGPENP